MRTYHCHVCDKKYKKKPEDVTRDNALAYCYCRLFSPTFLSSESNKTLDRKYSNIFKVKTK